MGGSKCDKTDALEPSHGEDHTGKLNYRVTDAGSHEKICPSPRSLMKSAIVTRGPIEDALAIAFGGKSSAVTSTMYYHFLLDGAFPFFLFLYTRPSGLERRWTVYLTLAQGLPNILQPYFITWRSVCLRRSSSPRRELRLCTCRN